MRTERQSAGCLCPRYMEALGKIAAQEDEIVRLKARVAHLESRLRTEVRDAREAPFGENTPPSKVNFRKDSDEAARLRRGGARPALQDVQNIFREHAGRMCHWARGPDIPAENNRAERGVGGLVMARKTSFGGQSEGALRVREVNQSVVEALALRHADPAGKLARAFDIYAATGKKSDVREFLFPKRRVGRLNCSERQAQR